MGRILSLARCSQWRFYASNNARDTLRIDIQADLAPNADHLEIVKAKNSAQMGSVDSSLVIVTSFVWRAVSCAIKSLDR